MILRDFKFGEGSKRCKAYRFFARLAKIKRVRAGGTAFESLGKKSLLKSTSVRKNNFKIV